MEDRNIKITTVVVGVTALAIILLVLRKPIKSLAKQIGGIGEKRDVNQELRDEIRRGNEPTLTDSQIRDIKSGILAQIAGCTVDDQPIIKQMKLLKNNADFLKLKKAWGISRWDGCNWEFDFGNTEGNLTYALSEMSNSAQSEVNSHLSSNGITYQI